jgi:DNA-binding SARP family transcriptional activator/tetratricopeptide (TPR) repeat protein
MANLVRVQRLDVRLLGGFGVEVDSRAVPDDAWEHGRATQLVKLLALAPGHRLGRDQVVEALWPHLEPDAGAANLHKAASYARKALGDRSAVVLRAGRVELAPGAEVSTDVERFETGDENVDDGELLPDDLYEEWTLEPRERLRARRLSMLREGGDWDRILVQDSTNEEAHRAVMRAQADRGDRAAAVRQFRTLREELATLGLTPEPATVELIAEISRGPAVQVGRPGRAVLVGREREVRLLERAVERAEDARGGMVALVGEPGVGKTRLAEAALGTAADRGWHVIRGSARPGEGATPYGPVVEALQPLRRERPDLPSQLPEGAAATLDALLPPARGDEDPGTPFGRHGVVATIAELLGAAARERGLLLCLDDMHDADDATVGLVTYLTRSAAEHRLLILLCIRGGDERPTVAQLRSALTSQGIGVDLPVEPLDRAAVEALAQRAAGRRIPTETMHTIVASAAGNPLYAEELAAAVDSDGNVTVPGHLHEVLDAHLEQLDAAAKRLLPLLAVLEDPFKAGEVAAMARLPEQDVLRALRDAAHAGVLDAATDEGFSFRHPLLREAARERVPDRQLAEAHAEVATRLAAADATPERIANHLLLAGRSREAVPHLADAARWALEVGAFGEGLAWVEAAVAHADEAQRTELLSLLAELRHRTGDPSAPAAYDRAAATAPNERRRIELRVQQARAYLATGELEPAARVLDALELGQASEADRARVTMARGIVAWHRGDIARARALATDAGTLYEQAGLVEEIGEQEDLAAMVAHADGRWTRHVHWRLGEVWELPQVAGRVYDAYLCVTEYVMQAGDSYDELREFADQLRVHARRAGARRGEAFANTVLGEAELLSGDPEAAREHLLEGVRASREVRAAGTEAVARARLAEASLLLNDRDGAAAQVEEALALAYYSPLAPHVLPLAHRIAIDVPADPDDSMERLERAESVLDADSMCPFCRVGYYVAAAGACAASGDPPRGWEFLARAERGAELWVGGTPWSAAIAQTRAELLLAEERVPEAAASLRRAVEGFGGAGQRLKERLAREALANVAT